MGLTAHVLILAGAAIGHNPLIVGGCWNRPDLEKHRKWLGSVSELPLNHFQGDESVPLVEGNRLRLGVHDDADTAEVAGHCPRQDEDCLEEGEPDPAPLCLLVHRQTREPKDGESGAKA